jgi:hypothetical protein
VGTPPDPVPHILPNRLEVQGITGLDQFFRHPLAPAAPVLLADHELSVQALVLFVHEESQDVDVVLPVEVGGDLGARNELDAQGFRLLAGLGKALERIVVGQRERGDPGIRHQPHEPGRRVEPVRNGRVAVQIDAHAFENLTRPPGSGLARRAGAPAAGELPAKGAAGRE